MWAFDEGSPIEIKCRWGDKLLYNVPDNSSVNASPNITQGTKWELKKRAGSDSYHIVSLPSGSYLHIQNGQPELAANHNGWHSAIWILENITGTNYFKIKNYWQGKYLHTENGLQAGDINDGWYSAMWTFEGSGAPQCNCPAPPNNTFRTQSKKTWAEFRMPEGQAGQIINIPKGEYGRTVAWPPADAGIHRVHWTNLTFHCNPNTCQWEKTAGSWGADGSPGVNGGGNSYSHTGDR